MSIDLTEEQQQALDRQRGFVEGVSYVLISKETYRRMMGIESEDDLADSLKAVEQGLADVEAGRTRPLNQFAEEFRSRHGISS